MAALTVNQWQPNGYNERTEMSGKPLYLFGHRVPSNVYTVSHWNSIEDGGVWIGWTTTAGNNHKHLLLSESIQDDVIALLVTMRMSE